MQFETLERIPELSSLYRRQVAKAIPGVAGAHVADDPRRGFRVEGQEIDPVHLAGYCRCTGFRLRDEAPALYPYVIAFPLAIQVMDAPGFPFPAMGTVHLSNDITQRRPLRVGEPFTVSVHAENLRPHRKGLVVDLCTSVEVGGEEIWRQTSAMLGVGAKFDANTPVRVRTRGEFARLLGAPGAAPPTSFAQLRFSAESVREYAEASGDKNPIHVSAVGAKLFGFPRPIAHGMFSHARMISAEESRVPQAVRVQADFYKPVVLPASCALFESAASESAGLEGEAPAGTSPRAGQALDLQLRKAKDWEALHVAARISW